MLQLWTVSIIPARKAALHLWNTCTCQTPIVRFFFFFWGTGFIGTDNLSNKQDWKGQKLWGRIFVSKNRSWKPEHASCSHARRLSGSRRSSRRSWCSLFHPNTRTHSQPPHDMALCCSSVAERCPGGCSPCWMLSAEEETKRWFANSYSFCGNFKKKMSTRYLCVIVGFSLFRLSVAGEVV